MGEELSHDGTEGCSCSVSLLRPANVNARARRTTLAGTPRPQPEGDEQGAAGHGHTNPLDHDGHADRGRSGARGQVHDQRRRGARLRPSCAASWRPTKLENRAHARAPVRTQTARAHRLAVVRRRAIMLQIASTMIAPTIDAINPAPSLGPYQPTS